MDYHAQFDKDPKRNSGVGSRQEIYVDREIFGN